MKKRILYSLIVSISLALGVALYSCGGSDALTAKLNKASGSTISTTQAIIVTFSQSIDETGGFKLAGTMADDSDGGVWSKDNTVFTITPKDKWDASAAGTLTVDASDSDKNTVVATYNIKLGFTSFQNAKVVIGQTNFTGSSSGTTASTLSGPYSNPTSDGTALIIGDYSNNRAVKFNTIPTTNGKSANIAIGQPDLVSSIAGDAADEISGPESAQIVDGKLFTLEYSNSRILIFNTVPTANQPSANVVVGQTAFGVGTSGCAIAKLNSPEGFYVAGGKLIVSDSSNNRVLIWNTIPTTNGKGADIVLGQSNFVHCTANDANQDNVADSAPSSKTLFYPSGVWSDGTRLVVSDGSNNRVLIWNEFPTTNFAKADVVLGQKDFTNNQYNDDNQDNTADVNASARTLNFPYLGVFSNGAQLFVPDYSNNRILIWNEFPTTNFAKADVVIGQSDFANNIGNDDDQNGVADANPTARTLSSPAGLTVVGDKLIVTDVSNNRALIYQGE